MRGCVFILSSVYIKMGVWNIELLYDNHPSEVWLTVSS